ncbi:MAG: hypothetical protein Q8R98_23100 [Rubrivivax sp.]|nr:hypothetical protein [Rubrivivax sp.]
MGPAAAVAIDGNGANLMRVNHLTSHAHSIVAMEQTNFRFTDDR